MGFSVGGLSDDLDILSRGYVIYAFYRVATAKNR
jgi:hypothetical protein